MTRQQSLYRSLAALIYLGLFLVLSVYFHHRMALESYYLAMAQTMQASGFSMIPNWQQVPLIQLAPAWVWLCQINAQLNQHHLIWLRAWSLLMTLWTCYLTLRLTQTWLPQEQNTSKPTASACALIILILTPAMAWFALSATPWPTVSAAIITSIYASFSYLQNPQPKYHLAYWCSLWLITLFAGLLFALPLLILPWCWPNRQAIYRLLASVRGFVIWLLIYGAWVYAAYRAAGTLVFSSANRLWWLLPNHGAWSAYNPFLPSALTLGDIPAWLALILVLPTLIFLPNAIYSWQRTKIASPVYLGLLSLAGIYAIIVGASQDIQNALSAIQIIVPILAIIAAPYVAWLLKNQTRFISALTHLFALFLGVILLLAIGLPRFHGLLPMLSPSMRLALIVIILMVYIPLLIARWVNIRTALITWFTLLALGLLCSIGLEYHYQEQQSPEPLFKQIKSQSLSSDVIANVGVLRPELWLTVRRRVIQISPLSAQISVPSNPLLVDPQQFIVTMHNNGRGAWLIVNNSDLAIYPQLLSNYPSQGQIADVWLLAKAKES